jgi:uncharacterized membrane protein
MEFIVKAYKSVFHFFDRLEDHVRGLLSKYPIWYAVIAGICIVLFWRGVWHTGDILQAKGGFWGFVFSGPVSLAISTILLLMIGVFVSAFVGDMLVLSGIKKEKKMVDKTEDEIKKEEGELEQVEQVIDDLYGEVDEVSDKQEVLEKKIDEQSALLKQLLDK